jgi:hypothetical protein
MMCVADVSPDMPASAVVPDLQSSQNNRRKKANKAKDMQGMQAQTNQSRSDTVLTGPMGDTDTASIDQQTLLGS